MFSTGVGVLLSGGLAGGLLEADLALDQDLLGGQPGYGLGEDGRRNVGQVRPELNRHTR